MLRVRGCRRDSAFATGAFGFGVRDPAPVRLHVWRDAGELSISRYRCGRVRLEAVRFQQVPTNGRGRTGVGRLV
jgi:hypothetical protein